MWQIEADIKIDGKHFATVVVCEGSEAAKRCGIKFNPKSSPIVDVIKASCAIAIQVANDNYDHANLTELERNCLNKAKDKIESGQMDAVKGLFIESRD